MQQEQNALTVEEVTSKLPQLRADFEEAFGEGSFKKYYYEKVHGNELMQDDEKNPWNRIAHPVLMAYLLNLGLGRYEDLPQLKETFIHYATKPQKDDDPEYAARTDDMLSLVHEIMKSDLNDDIPDYDPDNYWTPHAA